MHIAIAGNIGSGKTTLTGLARETESFRRSLTDKYYTIANCF